MNIKRLLKNNKIFCKVLDVYKINKKKRKIKDGITYNGEFINRSKDKSIMCMVLAGYKEYLYPAVFGRLIRYIPNNIDVCIITSGKYSKRVNKICEKYGWSYLSTKENNVSLVQNVAINLHPHAEYIFKLDEDMFLTDGYFEKMLEAYKHAEKGNYMPGVIAPTIPINGYGYLKILEEYELKDYYGERFEIPKVTTDALSQIECNPDVAEFFWGKDGKIPSIDEMNKRFEQHPINEVPCSIRFSIGAILFKRKLWDEMGHFSVDKSNNAMGVDETELCTYCCLHSQPLMVSDNIVIGHLAYGPQNERMKQYVEANPNVFMVSKK